jgi:hypothetical protein
VVRGFHDQPNQGKKKGSDIGINGIIYFKDCKDSMKNKDNCKCKKGKNVGASIIRNLAGTMTVNQEKKGNIYYLNTSEKTEIIKSS